MTDELQDRYSFLEVLESGDQSLPPSYQITCSLRKKRIPFLTFSKGRPSAKYSYFAHSNYFRARFNNKKYKTRLDALLVQFDQLFLRSIVIRNLARQEEAQRARDFLSSSTQTLSANAYDAFSSIGDFLSDTICSVLCSITQSGTLLINHLSEDEVPNIVRKSFVRTCRRTRITDVLRHRAIIHKFDQVHYYFLPVELNPFAFNEGDHPQVLVLIRPNRISEKSLSELTALVTLAQQRIAHQRLGFVQKYSENQSDLVLPDMIDEYLTDQIGDLLRESRDCTLADSVTFRRYNPVSANLEIVTKIEGSQNYLARGTVSRISALVPAVSLNAFVFARAHDAINGINISNTSLLDSSIFEDDDFLNGQWALENGFRSITASRLSTKSEYCLPVFFNALPIGTLNFESRLVGAFNSADCSFLVSARNFLEQLLRSAHEAEDRHWLATQAFTTMNIHEIQQLKESRRHGFTKEQLEELNRFIDSPNAKSSIGLTLQEIVPRLSHYLLKEYLDVHFLEKSEANEMVSRTIRDLDTKSNCDIELGFEHEELALLDYILRNMAQNKARVPRKFNEQITIAVRTHLDESKYLEFRNYIVNYEEVDVNLFGLRPMPRNTVSDTRSHRLGLYFIGLAARRLGGGVSVFPADGRKSGRKASTVVYCVRIPIGGDL